MAASDAKPIPIKNTAYRVTFPIYDADGDLVSGATGLDSEVSKDGGSFADCTNEATEIGSSGFYYLDLTSTEMNADTVVVQIKTSTSGAKTTGIVMYPQESGDVKATVEDYASGKAPLQPTTAGRTLDVTATGAAGIDWGTSRIRRRRSISAVRQSVRRRPWQASAVPWGASLVRSVV